ncbi:metal ABC transporter solute-binding protein, Zn/Mn family [Apilactobacillus xinyiensis]|uniref:metal ABC transporter solute-binding protein, Zn/Mn family n=1 Tax=Apilactobacillus xinyiensis TaxID=2841032 RepID=UPI00200E3096|nr:zinc ABC transporter substrate-binding protein [Apilactobacillus xinyiensis]MCL0330197.1 zinc ABC transporter substrate-binding protein [Apilactobacillus xinyiensis]
MKYLYNIIAFLAIIIFIVTLSSCSQKVNKSNAKIRVVATTNTYGQVAKKVLGNKGQVISIINKSNIDPHDYQPTTITAEQVTNANVLISNGLGYDSWMNSISVNAKKATKISVGENLLNLKSGDNPHVWYKVTTMIKLANHLADVFSKKDTSNRHYYHNNAAKYISSLSVLQKQIKTIKSLNHHNKVDVSEPVFNYALDEMGYKINNPSYALSVEKGTDPTPQQIRLVENDIKHKKIKFFVNNIQDSNDILDNFVDLAKQNHVPVINVTETMPQNDDYKQWMFKQNEQVLKIERSNKY